VKYFKRNLGDRLIGCQPGASLPLDLSLRHTFLSTERILLSLSLLCKAAVWAHLTGDC